MLLTVGVIICAVRWKAWFVNPDEPEWTADTLDVHFCTYGMDSVFLMPDTLQILLLGDVHNSLSREQYLSIADRHPNLTCYAQLGDFMDRGYFYYAQELVHQLDSTPFRTMPIINCAGNHEYHKGIARRLPDFWFDMFPQPQNGPINFLGRSYFVDFPHLRFIVVDTGGIHDLRDFTRVVTWTKATIRGAGDRFTIVMMHHPVLSTVKKRFNLGVCTFFYRTLSEANLVFAGHDHNYARRLPFVNISSVTTRSRQVSSFFSFDCKASGAFYALLTVTPSSLFMQVYTIDDGELVDSVEIAHVQ